MDTDSVFMPLCLPPFTAELEARLAGTYGPTVLTRFDVWFAMRKGGFTTVTQIQDASTGRWVRVDAEIYIGDVDWLIRMYQDRFDLDWKLDEAERERWSRFGLAAWSARALGDDQALMG